MEAPVQETGIGPKASVDTEKNDAPFRPTSHRATTHVQEPTRLVGTPMLMLVVSVFLGYFLIPSAVSHGFPSLWWVALLVTALAQAVSLWFLIWALLALLSTVRIVPDWVRRGVANAVISLAPRSSKALASRALASTAIASTALVGPVALAEEGVVDDLLWDTTISQVGGELESAATPEPASQEVWLPGVSPDLTAAADSVGESQTPVGDHVVANPPQVPPTSSEPGPDTSRALQSAIETEQPPKSSLRARSVARHAMPEVPEANGVHPSSDSDSNVSLTAGSTDPGGTRGAANYKTVADSIPASEVYVVEPGDCLWNIAAGRLPQDATDASVEAAWQRIYIANQQTIGGDPNLIEPGQVLHLEPSTAR